ncbi:MAG: hypothetical protein OHK0013_37620 [Sandaracinaceae bacterium]
MELVFPPWSYPLLELGKLLSVVTLWAGTVGVFLTTSFEDRQRAAFWLAGPGFGLSWAFGFALALARNVSTLSPWIVGSIALSLVSINVVLYVAGKEGRRTHTAAALAIVPLVGTMALMVYRPG